MKPKNNLSQFGKFELETREYSRSMREGREERTKDLVCILNVDFNYKHRFRDIIFAGKDAGKKLAIAYCRAPTTIPHPEYLKRNPLWIVKQTKTILLLLFLHLSLPFPFFRPIPATRFLPLPYFTRRRNLLLDFNSLVQRVYQLARERLGNIFPRLWTKGDPNKVGGDCILELEMFASCFLARGWAKRESLLEEISPSFYPGDVGWMGLKVSNWKFEARVVLLGAIP